MHKLTEFAVLSQVGKHTAFRLAAVDAVMIHGRVTMTTHTVLSIKSLACRCICTRMDVVPDGVRVIINTKKVEPGIGIAEIDETDYAIDLFLGRHFVIGIYTSRGKVRMLVSEGIACCMRCRIDRKINPTA